MYNYYLGGKSWYNADADAARRVIQAAPDIPAIARENFLFAGRATAWAVTHLDVRQVLDVGVGLVDDVPMPSVEACVRQARPDATVVAFDHDQVVLSHARVLRKPGYGGVLYGDVTDPASIIDAPELNGLIDLNAPVVVVLAAVLHFVPEAQAVMAELRKRLAPGSAVVLSHITAAPAPSVTEESSGAGGVTSVYENVSSQIIFRTEQQIRDLVNGWTITDPPGVCDIQHWDADGTVRNAPEFADVRGLGLVAVLPGLDGRATTQ